MSETPDEHHSHSTTTTTTVENTTDKKKMTLGEELWQVHVNRAHFQAVTPDDVDHEVGVMSSKPSTGGPPHRSVGEELWEVHCKRARGALDEDYPEEGKDRKDMDDAKQKKRNSAPHESASMETSTKVIHHLRNRDVVISSS